MVQDVSSNPLRGAYSAGVSDAEEQLEYRRSTLVSQCPALVYKSPSGECIEIMLIASQQAVDATVGFEPWFVKHFQLLAESMKFSLESLAQVLHPLWHEIKAADRKSSLSEEACELRECRFRAVRG